MATFRLTPENASTGMVIFRSRFEKFKARLRHNQKQASTWTVTRWSVHDYARFRELVANITEILDGLETVTSTLEGLVQKQQTALIEEIESLSDTKSLRLLQTVASKSPTSSVLRVISDTASMRVSVIEYSALGTSFYTAPTHPGAVESVAYSVAVRSGPPRGDNDVDDLKMVATEPDCGGSLAPRAPSPPPQPELEIPQHQRWMASLSDQWDAQPREPEFTSGDTSYGQGLKPIKESDGKAWEKKSTALITRADKGISLAQRVFVELRSIRRANVPFISAAPIDDRLDCLLASIEGPPGTPYEGGVFWITVKLVADKPPMLRFQTRLYHPNIDCNGKLCANYQEWWSDQNLRAYMGTITIEDLPWWSERRSNSYSLGAVLVALCGLLAHPNVEDPLVPEIAATYITDYTGYVRAARLYTEKYAFDKTVPRDLKFADDELSVLPPAMPVAPSLNKTDSSAGVAYEPSVASERGSASKQASTDIQMPRQAMIHYRSLRSSPENGMLWSEASGTRPLSNWAAQLESYRTTPSALIPTLEESQHLLWEWLSGGSQQALLLWRSRTRHLSVALGLRSHEVRNLLRSRPRKATSKDCVRYGIPPDLDLEMWNPEEQPILLLKTVFDADSVGKWIYDCTSQLYGPETAVAGIVHFLSAQLTEMSVKAGRIKKALHILGDNPPKKILLYFLEAASRLVCHFQDIIRRCERTILDTIDRGDDDDDNGDDGNDNDNDEQSGREDHMGAEFFKCMFGPKKELDAVEEFMTAAHEWCHCFELQCKEGGNKQVQNNPKAPTESLDDLREPRPPPYFRRPSS